jgi:hypothetical protein
MTRVEIEKSELDALKKKCEDQERTIREKDEIIGKLVLELDIFEGGKIQLTHTFRALDLQNRDLLIERLKSLPAPPDVSSKAIARKDTLLKEMQQDRENALERCDECEDNWQTFTREKSAAARILIDRQLAASMQKGV